MMAVPPRSLLNPVSMAALAARSPTILFMTFLFTLRCWNS